MNATLLLNSFFFHGLPNNIGYSSQLVCKVLEVLMFFVISWWELLHGLLSVLKSPLGTWVYLTFIKRVLSFLRSRLPWGSISTLLCCIFERGFSLKFPIKFMNSNNFPLYFKKDVFLFFERGGFKSRLDLFSDSFSLAILWCCFDNLLSLNHG